MCKSTVLGSRIYREIAICGCFEKLRLETDDGLMHGKVMSPAGYCQVGILAPKEEILPRGNWTSPRILCHVPRRWTAIEGCRWKLVEEIEPSDPDDPRNRMMYYLVRCSLGILGEMTSSTS